MGKICCKATLLFLFCSLAVLGNTAKTNKCLKWNSVPFCSLPCERNSINLIQYVFHDRNLDGNYTYEGFGYEISRLLSDFFHMNEAFVHVDPGKSNDLTMAFINKLTNREVDMIAYSFEIRLGTRKFMALSYPTWMVNKVLLQLWPEEESRLLAPIRPFTIEVWIGFFLSTAGFVTFMCVLAWLTNKIQNSDLTVLGGVSIMLRDIGQSQTVFQIINDQLHYVVTIITNQGNYIRYSARQSIRIVVSCWLLAMVVMVYAYTGVLTAVLSVPKLKPIFNTFEDVIATNRLEITIETHGLLPEQILSATSGTYKIIGDSLRDDPSLLVPLMPQALNNVLRRGCVYPAIVELASLFITEDTRRTGKCRLTMALKPIPFYVGFQIGFPIDNPHRETIEEHFIIRMWDNGMMSYIKKKYFPAIGKCRVDNPPESKTKPISLTDLTAPFFILGVGASLATITFILEWIYRFAEGQSNTHRCS